jgi:hypothetical protein
MFKEDLQKVKENKSKKRLQKAIKKALKQGFIHFHKKQEQYITFQLYCFFSILLLVYFLVKINQKKPLLAILNNWYC